MIRILFLTLLMCLPLSSQPAEIKARKFVLICADTQAVIDQLVRSGQDIMIIADTYYQNGDLLTMWASRTQYTIVLSNEETSCMLITGPIKPTTVD